MTRSNVVGLTGFFGLMGIAYFFSPKNKEGREDTFEKIGELGRAITVGLVHSNVVEQVRMVWQLSSTRYSRSDAARLISQSNKGLGHALANAEGSDPLVVAMTSSGSTIFAGRIAAVHDLFIRQDLTDGRYVLCKDLILVGPNKSRDVYVARPLGCSDCERVFQEYFQSAIRRIVRYGTRGFEGHFIVQTPVYEQGTKVGTIASVLKENPWYFDRGFTTCPQEQAVIAGKGSCRDLVAHFKAAIGSVQFSENRSSI